ncbi:MAG: diguanylate cyclase [Pseudonocardiales bacterium]|jgi:diguanylate cyclase (GGDEF)-like protein|nr:diguanylate cyclase [Pseudonocardiales bacterium]MDT4945389.1 diguanylate cyclase [Pseudonocardiales bacterium]
MASELIGFGHVQDGSTSPLPGFAMAAEAVVTQLSQQVDMDLWLVTGVDGYEQRIVASSGRWAAKAPPGTAIHWVDAFCRHMLEGRGPTFAPNTLNVPAYAEAGSGPLTQVRSYIGVPLLRAPDKTFGTLCAFSETTRPQSITDCRSVVEFVARLLSTVASMEAVAQERAEEAAHAYELLERDGLTQLYNGRGWQSALQREDKRCRRYGLAASVVSVDIDDLKALNQRQGRQVGDDGVRRCAEVVAAACRPGDVAARPGGGEFTVLAVECDVISVRALVVRLRRALRSAGIPASVSGATRRTGEDLLETWHRAFEGMLLEKRGRRAARQRHPSAHRWDSTGG